MSKRLPNTTQNCSIWELDLFGLAINKGSFAYLSEKVDIDAIVDHLTLIHIIKSEAEPTTYRTKKIVRGVKFIFFQPVLYKM